MAEENVTYKINFDQADLEQKLTEIKNQIDLVLGSANYTGSAMNSVSPFVGAAGVSDPVTQAALGNSFYPATAPPDPGTFSQSVDNSFWSNLTSFLDEASQSTQIGYSKFVDDIQRFGIFTSPPQTFNFASLQPTTVTDTFGSFLADNAFMASFGTIGGMAAGPVGGAIGGAIGGGVDIFGDLVSGRLNQRDAMAGAFRKMAKQSFSPITFSESEGIADFIQDQVYSFDGRLQGLDMDTIQSNILSFGNAGGFSQARGPEDMQRIVGGIISNAEEFANNFGIAQEQAMNVLANLEQRMVTTTSEAGGFSARISAAASAMGMRGFDLLNLGIQGTDLVQGTGVDPVNGFNIAIGARQQTQRMFNTGDALSRNLINGAGGLDASALSMAQSSMNFMQSAQGMLQIGSMLGGYDSVLGAGGDISGMLGGFSDYVSADMSNLLGLPIVAPFMAADMSTQEMQTRMVGMYVDFLSGMGLTNGSGQVDQAALAQMMVTQGGLSPQQALMAVQSVQSGMRDPYTTAGRDAITMIQSAGDSSLGVGNFFNAVGGEISDAFQFPRLAQGFKNMEYFMTDRVEDVVDFFTGNQRFRPTRLGRGSLEYLSEAEQLLDASLEQNPVTDQDRRLEAFGYLTDLTGRGGVRSLRARRLLSSDYFGAFSSLSYGETSQSEKISLMNNLLNFEESGVTTSGNFMTDLSFVQDYNRGLNIDLPSSVIAGAMKTNAEAGIDDSSVQGVLNSAAQNIYKKSFSSLTGEEQAIVSQSVSHAGVGFDELIDKYSFALNSTGLESASTDRSRAAEQMRSKLLKEGEGALSALLKDSPLKGSMDRRVRFEGIQTDEQEYIKSLHERLREGTFGSVDDELNRLKNSEFSNRSKKNISGWLLQQHDVLTSVAGTFEKSNAFSALADIHNFSTEQRQYLRGVYGNDLTEDELEALHQGQVDLLKNTLLSGEDFQINYANSSPRDREEIIRAVSSQMRDVSKSREEVLAQMDAMSAVGGRISQNEAIQSLLSRSGEDYSMDIEKRFFNKTNKLDNVLNKLDTVMYGGQFRVTIADIEGSAKEYLTK